MNMIKPVGNTKRTMNGIRQWGNTKMNGIPKWVIQPLKGIQHE